MALNDENGVGTTMLVQPSGYGYGGGVPYAVPMYGNYGGGLGSFGGDWSAMIILFLFAAMFGGFGGGWGMGGFGGGLGFDFPWLLNGQQGINANTNAGFNQAATTSAIGDLSGSVNSGFRDVLLANAGTNQQICSTGGTITAAVTGAQSAISQQLYNNEINSLNRSFAEQTANTAGFTATNTGIADLKYTVATENCADRQALSDGIRDLLAATQAQTQTILTQMCNDKIESKNDTIAQLRQELLYARGQASQDVQTAQILAGQSSIPGQTYTRLSECPVGTVPVYGNQRIFTCNNNGCGCGCNGFNG